MGGIRGDRVKTGDGRTDGKKPRMRDCVVRDETGAANWSATSRDFPMKPEMARQLAAEKRARGERE